MTKLWRVAITSLYALATGVMAAQALETTRDPNTDLQRLAWAFLVGIVVQFLTLLTNGRGFSRVDRMKSKPRAWVINVCESILAGIACAALIGVSRGILNFDIVLSGEFAISAVAGSYGAEYVFKRLEKRTIGQVLREDDHDPS